MTTERFAHLPHNQAADNNKQPIYEALNELDLLSSRVLEIGSGTGQHGVYFCQNSKNLTWQLTEHPANMAAVLSWHKVAESENIDNLLAPVSFDIAIDNLSQMFNNVYNAPDGFDVVYSANVLHIVSKKFAKHMIDQCADFLIRGQKLVCYGPFKQNQKFTTESNAEFDCWLRSEGYGGINDIADIEVWSQSRLKLTDWLAMPANNFLLVYQKL
ncbi:MAG: DUF938 domain-containing protein [Gammaproteobacteria bacterium]|nr:DUF938 domain-containing protein [Gammaproteobacteria bacterium]